MVAAHTVQHTFCGTLHSCTMIEYVFRDNAKYGTVQALQIEQRSPVAGDIFWMNMVGRGEGFPHGLGYLYRLVLQGERLFQVNNVGPFHCLCYHFLVARGIVITLRFDQELEHRKYIFLEQEFRLWTFRVGIGTSQHTDFVSGLFQVHGGTACRCSHTVSCHVEIIDYD